MWFFTVGQRDADRTGSPFESRRRSCAPSPPESVIGKPGRAASAAAREARRAQRARNARGAVQLSAQRALDGVVEIVNRCLPREQSRGTRLGPDQEGVVVGEAECDDTALRLQPVQVAEGVQRVAHGMVEQHDVRQGLLDAARDLGGRGGKPHDVRDGMLEEGAPRRLA